MYWIKEKKKVAKEFIGTQKHGNYIFFLFNSKKKFFAVHIVCNQNYL